MLKKYGENMLQIIQCTMNRLYIILIIISDIFVIDDKDTGSTSAPY